MNAAPKRRPGRPSTTTQLNMPADVRKRLEELKLTVSGLANKINVVPTTLYAVLAGKHEPSISLAIKIACGLGWTDKTINELDAIFFSGKVVAEFEEYCKTNDHVEEHGTNPKFYHCESAA
jgi:DNA-binding XRE family transcriptional regulator